jgi:hypothetical protein
MTFMLKIIIHGHLQGIQGLCKIKQSKSFKQNSLELQLQNIFKFRKLFYTTIHEPHAQHNHSWPSVE